MTDVRAALVAEMNRPADPRRASAEALLTRLEHEFGDLDALRLGQADGAPLEAAGPAPVRLRRWRVAGPARATRAPTWRVAAAFAAAVVVGGVLVVARDASTPASALSVLRAARERFADLPPFEADVFRRHPGADVADLSAGADPVPDLETEHLVQYEDEAH
ncbi:MAG TPA: hypothetical protein VFO65_09985, partial [Acidimicrobiales bacterium]|nr:hypothetical protein [Acidimicrobiales bacterium]